MITSLMTKPELDGYVAGLKANDCIVRKDRSVGTVEVFDEEACVLKAIEKGYGQPWIVSFIESGRIKWKTRENE